MFKMDHDFFFESEAKQRVRVEEEIHHEVAGRVGAGTRSVQAIP